MNEFMNQGGSPGIDIALEGAVKATVGSNGQESPVLQGSSWRRRFDFDSAGEDGAAGSALPPVVPAHGHGVV